jgi:hypothetical protein
MNISSPSYDAPMTTAPTKPHRALLVAACFVAGCAGSQAARVLVPAARADAPPLQKWEYACRDQSKNVSEMANEFAKGGWEMVAAAGAGHGSDVLGGDRMVWCFKRPVN